MTLPLRATLPGRLVRRWKRFFAEVETREGRRLVVHCPDPGSLRGLLRPGAAVRCSTSDRPTRKLRHTLEMVRAGRVWVGVHTRLANDFTERLLAAGALPELAGYPERRREVASPFGGRLDFQMAGRPGDPRPAWLEVKSVTLAEGRTARFPDSVTERGRRHAELLGRLVGRRARAALLFVVQRADCARVEPADEIDPAYAAALRAAARRGVEVLAVRARVTPTALRFDGQLPVQL